MCASYLTFLHFSEESQELYKYFKGCEESREEEDEAQGRGSELTVISQGLFNLLVQYQACINIADQLTW